MINFSNIVFVFTDQLRLQSLGYAGDPNIETPNIDRLASECVNCVNALSGTPVCSPYRASLMTGQYPLTHGVFVNDVQLKPKGPSIAETFASNGYDTAYIGKWHIHGHGRSNPIPREDQLGFDYWKVLECTHDYNNSPYYEGDFTEKKYWKGYDAEAQTKDAIAYITSRKENEKPFLLMLSWGTPHAPYETAPEKFQAKFADKQIILPPNVPAKFAEQATRDLRGYYAHIAAIDEYIGQLRETIQSSKFADNTIFVFTSDHGDLLGSHGQIKKQQPYAESVDIPLLIEWPAKGISGARDALIDAPDIMPTLLGLCGFKIPKTVEGHDFSNHILGSQDDTEEAALLSCPHPFGQWKKQIGGREYRGVKTKQYTYVKDLNGPWLLFDNIVDPYQINNLVNSAKSADIQSQLETKLQKLLAKTNDEFLPGMEYIKKWQYHVTEDGTVPYTV